MPNEKASVRARHHLAWLVKGTEASLYDYGPGSKAFSLDNKTENNVILDKIGFLTDFQIKDM
jgi:hypothetical protein